MGKSPKAGKQPSIESIIRNTDGRGIIPGTPELVWEGGDVDEFTLDAKGNIYAALFNDNKVIKISLDGTATTLLEGGPAYNWFAMGLGLRDLLFRTNITP